MPHNVSEPAGSATRFRFWENLGRFGSNIALVDGDAQLTYAALERCVSRWAKSFEFGGKKLVFLLLERNLAGLLCYLGLLRAGHIICLCPEGMGANALRQRVERFCPDIIISQREVASLLAGYKQTGLLLGHAIAACEALAKPPTYDLALLLSTSGSTGNAKFVRLSCGNIQTAAEQVRAALNIGAPDRAITALPLDHVYGLSVLHSHLAAGASIVLTNRPISSPGFWDLMQQAGVTSLAGVSWSFSFLKDTGFSPQSLPHLRNVTHSTSAIDPLVGDWMLEHFSPYGIRTYFMYGQTEASGRICVLPPDLAGSKRGSVGTPVPGGFLGRAANGEIIYYGANVMQGYANNREDLARGDDMLGVLRTGDLGKIDSDGCLKLTGRLNRICKILGQRINLDEVQNHFHPLSVSVISGDDKTLTILFEENADLEVSQRAQHLAQQLRIPFASIALQRVKKLPDSSPLKSKSSYVKIP